jgi:hypothetical protein
MSEAARRLETSTSAGFAATLPRRRGTAKKGGAVAGAATFSSNWVEMD